MASGRYDDIKAWRKSNPDKVAAQARRYRAKHPDKIAATKARYRARHLEEVRERDAELQRKRRAADPEGQKERMRRYLERQEAKREQTAGRPRPDKCELCGEYAHIVFDHCHDRGHFRGWICDRCNRVLGSVEDREDLLLAMVDYLRRDRGQVAQDDRQAS